jgi:hypothetical protein
LLPAGKRGRCRDSIDGKLATIAIDAGTPIRRRHLARGARFRAGGVDRPAPGATGERAVFSLCRPPATTPATISTAAHCFLNKRRSRRRRSAMPAPSGSRSSTSTTHHGNGTQQIFYERGRRAHISLHADPSRSSPISSATPTSVGIGVGEGYH